MKRKNRPLRAIDLYSGVGGWALGLKLAGIEVVASYELWGLANETNFKNNHHQAQTVDIRRLSLDELPAKIDIVVGSPPCTQFSFANRGGNGDIADGLKDIIKFLTIVDHLRPKTWAMENVPRVAKIIEDELKPGGRLRRFRHLGISTHIVNMEDYGLPQARRRCIAGNFNFALLNSYVAGAQKLSLGDVVDALAADSIVDPIYGIQLSKHDLRDHVTEDVLNEEEVRINRASKTLHPVYNSMPFPDRLDRSVRTITATCTRVSRESIVIEDSSKVGTFRRLTIRERATLQGFPITFQFYGATYGQKLRMVGNAIPPAFSYYVGQAFKGVQAKNLPRLGDRAKHLKKPSAMPADAQPERAGAHYPVNRTFRFAIPSLRLKSGVRFELVNVFDGIASWEVNFYFGNSKSIQSFVLDRALYKRVSARLPTAVRRSIDEKLTQLADFIDSADIERMQLIWSHKGVGGTTPFMLLDELDRAGSTIKKLLDDYKSQASTIILEIIEAEYGRSSKKIPGVTKLIRNASLILTGILVGSLANIGVERRATAMQVHRGRRASQ